VERVEAKLIKEHKPNVGEAIISFQFSSGGRAMRMLKQKRLL